MLVCDRLQGEAAVTLNVLGGMLLLGRRRLKNSY